MGDKEKDPCKSLLEDTIATLEGKIEHLGGNQLETIIITV